jgi:D-xylose transport system permease protein
MSTAMAPPPTPAAPPEQRSIGDYARERLTSLRQGELGSLPIIVGLIVIAIIFQTQNDRFLTAGNFVNLIVQSAAIITIAMGVVWVLLLGEIDLSIGYVSASAGVLTALLVAPDGNEMATAPAIILCLLSGLGIGLAARADHHQGRRPVVRRHARRPARLERRRAAAHR